MCNLLSNNSEKSVCVCVGKERKKNKRIREDRDEKIDKVRERIYESSLF